MKCIIGGLHVRVFGRAIHALARIGDEFWFDPAEKGHYSCAIVPELSQNKKHKQLRCKLAIKAVLPVFRYLNTLERNVDKCKIYTDLQNSHVVFQLFCKHGVVKTHNLASQECEPLQVVFAKHLCSNVLKIQSRQLSDILIHFPSYQDEVTLAVTPLKVCFKTYLEDEEDFAKAMHTEIHLGPEEFEYFQTGVDSEVTFCLKELRGLLTWADTLNAPVSVHFDVPGRPVAFSIEDLVVEASFVLATLTEPENGTSSQGPLQISQVKKRSCQMERCSQDTINGKRDVQDTKRATTPGDMFTTTEALVPPDPNKFHSLFFGAVSPREQNNTHEFHTLATASDIEEDFGDGELSPAF